MTAELLPLLEAAVLLALGAFTRSRMLVVAAALLGLGWTVWSRDVAVLLALTPAEQATTFGGYAVGLVFGLVLAGMPRRRRPPVMKSGYPRDVGSGRSLPRPTMSGGGLLIRALLLAMGLFVAAIALYLQGSWVPEWRTTVDRWLASPTARSLGFPPPTPVPSTVSAPQPPASPTANGRSGTASAPGSARPVGADRPVNRSGAGTDRPRGDLRHCLERGNEKDVLNCAEGAR